MLMTKMLKRIQNRIKWILNHLIYLLVLFVMNKRFCVSYMCFVLSQEDWTTMKMFRSCYAILLYTVHNAFWTYMHEYISARCKHILFISSPLARPKRYHKLKVPTVILIKSCSLYTKNHFLNKKFSERPAQR